LQCLQCRKYCRVCHYVVHVWDLPWACPATVRHVEYTPLRQKTEVMAFPKLLLRVCVDGRTWDLPRVCPLRARSVEYTSLQQKLLAFLDYCCVYVYLIHGDSPGQFPDTCTTHDNTEHWSLHAVIATPVLLLHPVPQCAGWCMFMCMCNYASLAANVGQLCTLLACVYPVHGDSPGYAP